MVILFTFVQFFAFRSSLHPFIILFLSFKCHSKYDFCMRRHGHLSQQRTLSLNKDRLPRMKRWLHLYIHVCLG